MICLAKHLNQFKLIYSDSQSKRQNLEFVHTKSIQRKPDLGHPQKIVKNKWQQKTPTLKVKQDYESFSHFLLMANRLKFPVFIIILIELCSY